MWTFTCKEGDEIQDNFHREVRELSSQVGDGLVGTLDIRQGADDGSCFPHVESIQDFRTVNVTVEDRQTSAGESRGRYRTIGVRGVGAAFFE